METFIEPRALVETSDFQAQRRFYLHSIKDQVIDDPIVEIIDGLNQLSYCFTLQCCYGHFVYEGRNDIHNFDALPIEKTVSEIQYRIAYIAFCVENNSLGRNLIAILKDIAKLDSNNIQFCSAEWFWEQQVNSFALQVEPERFKRQDTAMIGYEEALYIEKLRNRFFAHLNKELKHLHSRR